MSSWRTVSPRASTRWLALGLSLAAVGAAPGVAQASARLTPVLTVTNTSDTNTMGSLRWAINQSNTDTPGPNMIDFAISGSGVQTIIPTSPLPTITTPVLIDGTTQSGYAGAPLIQLDGTNAGSKANGLTITAGSTTVKALEITHWGGAGVVLSGASKDTISDDYIGTDGSSALPNGNGITVSSQQNTIGGATSGNVISGNSAFGLIISGSGAKNNVVEGSSIGTDLSGSTALANHVAGVFVAGKATGNTIGGTATGAGNLISGNGSDGVDITGAGTRSNVVEGNYVGPDITGASALGNGNEGVAVYGGATKNIVGGATAAARNVVSANAHDGVAVDGKGTSGNHVEGNYIGINAAGKAALGNGGIGAPVYAGATGNTVGGTSPGDRNVISGNANYGATLVNTGTSQNVIEGNYIGTNPAGTAALGNKRGGVQIYLGSTHNVVGGTTRKARNLISGNGGSGVGIHNKGTSGNVIEGNFIGTKRCRNRPAGQRARRRVDQPRRLRQSSRRHGGGIPEQHRLQQALRGPGGRLHHKGQRDRAQLDLWQHRESGNRADLQGERQPARSGDHEGQQLGLVHEAHD